MSTENNAPPAPNSGTPWAKILVPMIASFAVAFGLAWYLFGRQPAPPEAPPPPKDIAAADLGPFLSAVRAEDYPLMAKTGAELFAEGAKIADRETALAGFEVDSFPPHQVYAFYTTLKNKTVYRVLLTLDQEDRIVSFLAEDMPVVD